MSVDWLVTGAFVGGIGVLYLAALGTFEYDIRSDELAQFAPPKRPREIGLAYLFRAFYTLLGHGVLFIWRVLNGLFRLVYGILRWLFVPTPRTPNGALSEGGENGD